MKNSVNTILHNRRSEAGIGLLEVLIAAVLFLVISGAVFGLLQVARIDRNRASRRSDTLKNARAAMHLIGRDVLNAGLSYHKDGGFAPDDFLTTRLGLSQDNNTDRDRMTAIIAGNNVFTNNLQTGTTDEISFIYRDMDFNDAKTVQLSSVAASPGNNTIPRVTLKPSTEQRCGNTANPDPCVRLYDLFLIQTDTTQVPVMATAVPSTTTVDFGPGDPLGLNQSLQGSGIAVSQLRKCGGAIQDNCSSSVSLMKKFYWVSYRISTDGTLVRTMFGNNNPPAGTADQIREQPLAYGIQDMQIRYVLEDGTVTDDPSGGPDGIRGTPPDTPGDMNLVRQVTITLKVQSSEYDEQRRVPETITITSTFATRNIIYDAG
jgi:type II secretory pathway pseudopilin PulG